MEQGLKERLIGAAVLVVLAVWLIPWLLDGPDDLIEDGPVSLQLPVPQEQVGQVRTETIDLRPRANDSPVISADDSAIGRRADVRTVEGSRTSSPSASTPISSDAPSVGAADVEAPTASGTASSRSDARSATAADSGSGDVAAETASGGAGTDASTAAATAAAETAVSPTPAAPTPAAPRPSPASTPPAATGDWALQLGSFGDESNARRLADRVSSFGYKPQITDYRAGGRTMYRVRVGPHETRARAEAAASALSAHGFVAQVVTAD